MATINNTTNATLVSGTSNADSITNASSADHVTIEAAEGNDTILNYASNVFVDAGEDNDYISVGNSNVTVMGGDGNDTIAVGSYNALIQYSYDEGNDVITGYSSTASITMIDGSTFSTVESGNDVIVNVGTSSMTLKNAKGMTLNIKSDTSNLDKISLTNADASPYIATSKVGTIEASARSKKITITGNSHANSILGGKGADSIDGGAGNDTLNGGNGNDSLTGGNGNDEFLFTSGGGADVITDYTADEDIIKLSKGELTKVAVDKNGNLTFTIDNSKGSFKVNSGNDKNILIADSDNNVLWNQKFGNNLLTLTDSDYATINSAIDSTLITVDGTARTLDINITANSKNNLIKLGANNATVTSGTGKDTIEASSNGNLLLTDYAVKSDRLKFSSDILDVQLNDNDLIFNLDGGMVTLEGGKSKKITVVDYEGNATNQVYCAETISPVDASDGSKFKAYTGTITLDASKRKSAVMLIGNSSDNTIIGGKNGKKNFDTLVGGTGADVFVYNKGAGYDIITDYSASEGDIIQLGDKAYITKAEVSGNDRIFTISGGSVTITGGASQDIHFKNTSGNEFYYTAVSSSTNALLQSDNYSTSDLNEIMPSDDSIAIDYRFQQTSDNPYDFQQMVYDSQQSTEHNYFEGKFKNKSKE